MKRTPYIITSLFLTGLYFNNNHQKTDIKNFYLIKVINPFENMRTKTVFSQQSP